MKGVFFGFPLDKNMLFCQQNYLKTKEFTKCAAFSQIDTHVHGNLLFETIKSK